MKKVFFLLLSLSLFIACSTNKVTGRKQLALFPEETLQQQALTEYRSFLSQNKVLSGTVNKDAERVARVGTRISKAITDYYTQKGLSKCMVYAGRKSSGIYRPVEYFAERSCTRSCNGA
jgi:hypothetical protein